MPIFFLFWLEIGRETHFVRRLRCLSNSFLKSRAHIALNSREWVLLYFCPYFVLVLQQTYFEPKSRVELICWGKDNGKVSTKIQVHLVMRDWCSDGIVKCSLTSNECFFDNIPAEAKVKSIHFVLVQN